MDNRFLGPVVGCFARSCKEMKYQKLNVRTRGIERNYKKGLDPP
jgi:hypothetical protein